MKTDFEPTIGIYALSDPTTGRVMYIGQSIDIDYRYRQHCNFTGSDNNLKKTEWLGSLVYKDLKPRLIILEKCGTSADLDQAEKKWIREYKARGEAELNIATGGSAPTATKVFNTHREEWFQLANKVKNARTLLLEVADDTGRMVSVEHLDAIMKLVRKLDREVNQIAEYACNEFPEWQDVSKALSKTQNPSI